MTEYKAMIERKRKQLLAEEWAKGIAHIHCHSINSMWYEPKPNVVKTEGVMDITYNDGRIERDGVEILPSQVSGEQLINRWEQFNEL